jgi:hypothetical protein
MEEILGEVDKDRASDGQAGPPSDASRLEYSAASWAVAWAQFVGLETVEQTQNFVWVAADVQIIDRCVLDHIVWVDQEGCSQGNACTLFANTQAIDQVALGVSEGILLHVRQIWVLTAPSQFAEFIVSRAAKDNAVAVRKLAYQFVKADDFGWANKGEILWVKIDQLPLTFEAVLGDVEESAFAVFFMGFKTRLYAGYGEFREGIANS